MTDMTAAIIPKSDQLNADDCITGPITIKISDVIIRSGQEQPVSIHYENDAGKPYKPCKSMSRVLVTAWGPDAKQYVGRSLTLYRDPSVKWGGMEVGGLRISHMTDIEGLLTMALTATKGSRKPFTVRPLEVAPPIDPNTDWPTEILGCQSVDELRILVDTRMSATLREQHKKLIVARKKELTNAAP